MLRYSILIILFPACTLGRLGDENCTTTKRGNFPALTTPDSVQWSIVDFREISNYCLREKFVYSGSYKEYHLIYWYYDDPQYSSVEHSFAVLKGTFSPSRAFEYAGRGGVLMKESGQRVFK